MGFAQGFSAGQSARIERDKLNLIKKQRDDDLLKTGYSFENGQMGVRPGSAAEAEQLQALETTQLAKSLQGKLSAQDTDKAFEDFAHTGDATYLQNALDNNPYLKQAWGQKGVQLVSNIDFENDSKLLSNAGFEPSFYDTPEKKDAIRKNSYKVYDGKDWSIGLANNAVMETGALTRLGARRGSVITDNYENFYQMLNGPKVSPHTAEGHKYESDIKAASEKYGVPENLIAAMMAKESAGNPNAVSKKGATGLMQLMPDTAKELGVTDMTNPSQNIDGGVRYFKQMLDKYQGDVPKALAAYNAGPGNVDKYNGIPPFGETQDYVNKIMANFDNGESYYGRKADNTANTILEHYRAIANAKQGTTNSNVDQVVKNDSRKLDQKDVELEQTDTANQLKLLDIQTKLKTDGLTTTQKDLNEAANTTNELLETYGGEDAFFNTDFTNRTEYNKAYRYMVKIEALEGTKLSEADKKSVTDIRTLLSLGDPAAKLTASETGLLDANFNEAKKYVSDEVGGIAATSAYSAFRNSVRNALFGSALTEGEIKAFNEAYGTLGEKAGPVLQQFKVSLEQVKAKLESTRDLMNPYSAKIRLGADQEKITKTIDQLSARIEYLDGLASGEQPKLAKNDRKPLAEIMGGK